MIFYNLKSNSLVDLYLYTYVYIERGREKERAQTKQIEKNCGLTFTCKIKSIYVTRLQTLLLMTNKSEA